MLYQQNVMRGALFIILSELMFASMGATVKLLSDSLPNEMIVFMRNLFGMLILLPLLWRYGLPHLHTRVWHLHLLRALAGLSAMYCFFYALAHLTLANGVLLKMTSPLFIPLIALFWLDEKVSIRVWLGILCGFIGVGLVLQPGGDFEWVAVIGLLGGGLAALAKVSVRRLSQTEPTTRIVFYFATLATLVSAVPLLWRWQRPEPETWIWLFFMGMLGTIGQLLLTRGYAMASPARIGAFTYTSVVFAGLLGYVFWQETLHGLFISGALLIALAGILVLRERRTETVIQARIDPDPL